MTRFPKPSCVRAIWLIEKSHSHAKIPPMRKAFVTLAVATMLMATAGCSTEGELDTFSMSVQSLAMLFPGDAYESPVPIKVRSFEPSTAKAPTGTAPEAAATEGLTRSPMGSFKAVGAAREAVDTYNTATQKRMDAVDAIEQ